MKNTNQFRQGDVLIERIAELPTTAVKQKGRVILAHGEVTGHAHTFDSTDAEKFTDDDGSEYFSVKGRRIKARLKIVRVWRGQVMVNHPTLGVIEFAKDDVVLEGEFVKIDGMFGLLKHDEHTAQGIRAGFYKGGSDGGKVRQREYSPKAILNVAD